MISYESLTFEKSFDVPDLPKRNEYDHGCFDEREVHYALVSVLHGLMA